MGIREIVALAGASAAVAVAGPTVVIAGDSFASGNGGGDYSNVACMQSPHAGQEVLGDLAGIEAVNVACTAAHIDHLTEERVLAERTMRVDLTDPDLASLGDEDLAEQVCDRPPSGGRVSATVTGTGRGALAECRTVLDPQIDFFAGADAAIITVGGNDLGFGQIAFRCFAVPDEGECRAELERARSSVDDLMVEYDAALREIRNRYPNLDIILVPYPPLISGTVVVDGYDVGVDMSALEGELSDALSELASSANASLGGVSFAGDIDALWTAGVDAGEKLIHTTGTVEILHPTPAGWSIIGWSYLLALAELLSAQQ